MALRRWRLLWREEEEEEEEEKEWCFMRTKPNLDVGGWIGGRRYR